MSAELRLSRIVADVDVHLVANELDPTQVHASWVYRDGTSGECIEPYVILGFPTHAMMHSAAHALKIEHDAEDAMTYGSGLTLVGHPPRSCWIALWLDETAA